MENTFQTIAALASIFSIPLAIYYSHKTANATSDKARLDIIKTLSYRLSATTDLSADDIKSVYQSKLREHKIKKAKFNIYDVVNDLKTDVMSNAFLENQIKNDILYNLSNIFVENIVITKRIRLNPMILVFFSTISTILFWISIICVAISLFPYVFSVVINIIINSGELDKVLFSNIFDNMFYDSNLHFSFILLIIFSVIMLARKIHEKKKLKQFEMEV